MTFDARLSEVPAAIAAGAVPTPPYAFASGTYLMPQAASTTGTFGNNTLRVWPWFCPLPLSIARIGAEITGAGEAGSKFRPAVMGDNAGGPGALLLDPGQINGDSATVQEIILGSPFLLPRGWCWLGGAIQSAPTTQPTLRTIATQSPMHGYLIAGSTSIPSAGTQFNGVSIGSVSGALPATGAGATPNSTMPRIFFKLS